MIKRISQISLSFLLLATLPVLAGQMYRYVSPDGVTVISRTLPPSLSQKGYDIINDKTMSLIRHVDPALSNEAIAEMLAAEKAAEEERIAEEKRKEQAKKDAAFLGAYHSEENLIRDRDYELSKRDDEILAAKEKQERFESSLRDLQERAAEQELGGQEISPKLKNNLQIVAENIDQNGLTINRLEADRLDRAIWYEKQLKKLHAILASKPAN